MNGLISIDGMSLRPISDELLALNEVSREYGLTLTAEEAKELSETRKTALEENERIEAGVGAVPEIVKKFCTSRYVTAENYTYVLNEITSLFYYIKTETDDRIGDRALIDELFERFELYCRGSIDVLEGREAERIIRKINAGKHYAEWYGDTDGDGADRPEASRDTPDNLLGDAFGEEYFRDGADHDRYEEEENPADILDEPEDDDPYGDFGEPGDEDEGLELYDQVFDETMEEDDPEYPLNLGGSLDVRFGDDEMQLSVGSAPMPFEDGDGEIDLDLLDRFFDGQARREADAVSSAAASGDGEDGGTFGANGENEGGEDDDERRN